MKLVKYWRKSRVKNEDHDRLIEEAARIRTSENMRDVQAILEGNKIPEYDYQLEPFKNPTKKLFEDPNFQLKDTIPGFIEPIHQHKVHFLRPHDFCKANNLQNPQFFIKNSEITQGSLGNCWCISGRAVGPRA